MIYLGFVFWYLGFTIVSSVMPFTKYGTTNPNDGASFLDGDGVVARHAHGYFLKACGIAEEIRFEGVEDPFQFFEFRADHLFLVGKGAHAHDAANANVLK